MGSSDLMGLVLAGGVGKRLMPLTRMTPKPFLKVGGKRLYQYSLEVLRRAGIKDIIVLVPEGYSVPEELGAGVRVREQRGYGLERAIRQVVEEAESEGAREVVLSYTGYIASPPTMALQALEYYSRVEYPVVMVVTSVLTGAESYGFVRLGYGGRVEEVRMTADREWLGGMGYVFAGVMVGDVRELRVLYEVGYERGLNTLASRGRLGALVWTGDWVEIAYPWDLLEAPRVIMSGRGRSISIRGESRVSERASIEGPAVIEDGAVIGDNVVIRGPVYVGRESRLEPGSVVGPNVIVEDGAVVGEYSVVRDSVIMEGARISPFCLIESSVVGEKASVAPMSVLEASEPVRVPERLRKVLASVFKPLRLGAIIPPGAAIGPFFAARGGEVVGGGL